MANQIRPINKFDLPFNPKPATVLHIDLNSCFATIEQQANPKLRGKPIAVAAYATGAGCILAPSIEAKKLGIKVGMRVKEGKAIYPGLIVLTPDPNKYRSVHVALKKILLEYTDTVTPKSIDEFVLDFETSPTLSTGMLAIGSEIKRRIKAEIGEWLTVSIGIAPNRFLAKLASGLHKPDGLDVIDRNNFLDIFSKLNLTDLPGIKVRNSIRLNNMGIFTVMDFFGATVPVLKAAFESIVGYYWYLRLKGWEIDGVDFSRRSYGNSYALPKHLTSPEELAPILRKLVEKTGIRLRKAGFRARGVHLGIVYRDSSYWHKGQTLPDCIFDSRDIYKAVFRLLLQSPYRKPVREIAESVFNLEKASYMQLGLFEDIGKKENLIQAIDAINERWGSFVITPASMLGMQDIVVDRIAFGGVKDLGT